MNSNIYTSILKRIGELKIDVLFSKKGHYNAAALWNWTYYSLGIVTAALAAFIGIKNSTLTKDTIAVLAMASAALGAINTFLKPQEKAVQHKRSGDEFDLLLQRMLNFSEVEILTGSDSEHTAVLEKMTKQKTELNKSSAQIPRLAYFRAKKGVKKGEASYTEKLSL
jgi:hypothetical protein